MTLSSGNFPIQTFPFYIATFWQHLCICVTDLLAHALFKKISFLSDFFLIEGWCLQRANKSVIFRDKNEFYFGKVCRHNYDFVALNVI